MKKTMFFPVLFIIIILSACDQGIQAGENSQTSRVISPTIIFSPTPSLADTNTVTPLPSPTETLIPTLSRTPYPSRTPSPIPSSTLTPPPTLEPIQANEVLASMFKEPPAPCLWDIIPGKTTIGEAYNIFLRLGISLQPVYEYGKYYSTDYEFKTGLSVHFHITTQEDIVKYAKVSFYPKNFHRQEWIAYSPETLIRRYGPPSKVDFWVGGGPEPEYAIDMYFESVDLIMQYISSEDILQGSKDVLRFCPLRDQMHFVGAYLGEPPETPPSEFILLEKATSMTLVEFADLMIGDPWNACIEIRREVFFP